MKTVLGLIGLVTVLTGCGLLSTTEYASNNKKQYLKSRNGPDLVIAPPLSASNISDFYRLPDQTQNATVSIVPPRDREKRSST